MSCSENKKLFNVPAEICRYVASTGKFREASVYFFLKFMCDGNIAISNNIVQRASTTLNISTRTVSRSVKWLKEEGWLEYRYDNKYTVISFKRLLLKIGQSNSKSGILWDDPDFTKTKQFVITGCVRKIIFNQKMKKRASAKGNDAPPFSSHKDDLLFREYTNAQSLNFISKSYFAGFLRVPLTTAYDYLRFITLEGWVIKNKNYTSSAISPGELAMARKFSADPNLNKLRKLRNGVVILLPNSFISNLIARKRSLF